MVRAESDVIGPRCHERFLPLDQASGASLRAQGVQLAGISELAPPYEMARRSPAFHVVLATLAGQGWCEIAGGPTRLRRGDLLIAPAHSPSAYGVSGRQWRIAWFHLDRDRGLGAALRDRQPTVHKAAPLDRLVAAMEGFLSDARGDDPREQRAAELGARLVGCHLERTIAADLDPRAAQARRRLHELQDAIDADLRRTWCVADLAAHLHESPATLFRLCARHAGEKPMAMVTRLRMERARQLLRETDEPIKAIAQRVGYASPFAFSAAFKRIAGVSPKAVRDGR